MLGKLLKYEFKALYKKILLFVAGGLLLSCLMLLLFSVFFNVGDDNIMLGWFLGSGMVFTVLALAAIAIVSLVFIIQRFYTNLCKDEGYLSFTLPVTASQHLWAKLISGAVWMTITGIGVIASYIILFGGMADIAANALGEDIFADLGVTFDYLFEMMEISPALFIAELIVGALVSAFADMMIIYLCIIMGSVIASKHKVLMAVLLYFAVMMAISWITGMVNIIAMMISSDGFASLQPGDANHITFAVNSLLYICIFGVAFGVCKHIMTKKLNLE